MSSFGAILRGLASLLVLVLASALLTTALAPLVHQVLLWLGAFDPSYPEVVFRTLQLSAIAFTGVALALLGAQSRASWGLALALAPGPRALRSFALGTLALGLVVSVLYLLQVRTLRYDVGVGVGYWASVVLRALLSALIIASVEELWFRGGLFSLLQRCGGTTVAVWIGSIVYALTHFIEFDGMPVTATADWRAAAGMLVAGVRDLLRLQDLDSMLALLAAGLWLSVLRWRQSDIIGAIMLHMSFVVVIKVFKKLTYIEPDAPARWLAGRYDDVIGWLAFAVLLAFATFAWRRAPAPRASHP